MAISLPFIYVIKHHILCYIGTERRNTVFGMSDDLGCDRVDGINGKGKPLSTQIDCSINSLLTLLVQLRESNQMQVLFSRMFSYRFMYIHVKISFSDNILIQYTRLIERGTGLL